MECLSHVGTVNVGNKVSFEVSLRVVLKRLSDHDRAQVGTTDTNVNDVGDSLASVTLPGTSSDGLGELLHVVQDALDLISTCLADAESGLIENVPEGDVEDGSTLGGVDVVTGEHLVSELLNSGLLGELQKSAEDFIVDQVLGEIEQDSVSLRGGGGSVQTGVSFESLRVREEVLEDELGLRSRVQLLELLPSRVFWRGQRVGGER